MKLKNSIGRLLQPYRSWRAARCLKKFEEKGIIDKYDYDKLKSEITSGDYNPWSIYVFDYLKSKDIFDSILANTTAKSSYTDLDGLEYVKRLTEISKLNRTPKLAFSNSTIKLEYQNGIYEQDTGLYLESEEIEDNMHLVADPLFRIFNGLLKDPNRSHRLIWDPDIGVFYIRPEEKDLIESKLPVKLKYREYHPYDPDMKYKPCEKEK